MGGVPILPGYNGADLKGDAKALNFSNHNILPFATLRGHGKETGAERMGGVEGGRGGGRRCTVPGAYWKRINWMAKLLQ